MSTSGLEGREATGAVPVPPLGLGGSLVLFGVGALLATLITRVVVPALVATRAGEPVLVWFLAGGLGLFTPLLLLAAWLLHREGAWGRPRLWSERLRFHPMSGRDWFWSLAVLVVGGLLTGGILAGLVLLLGDPGLHPPFLTLEPLTPGRYWILAAWLPFWVLNIMGEEILWRGVILPRQEVAFGNRAWLANAVGWLLFHVAFPWQILLTTVPLILLLPWAVQRRRNSWVGVILHAAVNGPGFLAVAFGLA